ncbi:MAG: AGE family epimerase/isomerase [Cellulomonadaceae bacterium]
MQPWFDSATHRRWLEDQTLELLAFGRRVGHPIGGAARLDEAGVPDLDAGVETWITARTVHVYALGALLGVPGSAPIAQHALNGLTGVLHDDAQGGWFTAVAADGTPVEGKSCYAHAFVLLAAGSGVLAGLDGAPELLAAAIDVFETRFWDEEAGRCVDTWDTAFTQLEDYRGVNANMHAVEAMLATHDVTGDPVWLDRARRVTEFVLRTASEHGWTIPEHYDAGWTPLLDYNTSAKSDPFKPYGVTVGHSLEWARLVLHLEAALGTDAPAGLLDAARSLYARAVEIGWAVDGADGFVYTTDWDGTPIVRERMHWVLAEAVGAAAALARRTGEQIYAEHYAMWWDYADSVVLDHSHGSWYHELDTANQPSGTVWPGKPDLYHAVQATLIPRLPLTPSIASAVAEGELR